MRAYFKKPIYENNDVAFRMMQTVKHVKKEEKKKEKVSILND